MSDEGVKAKSDLGVRTLSATMMIAVAGIVLVLGGIWLDIFIGLIALAVFVELALLVLKATANPFIRLTALAAGLLYVGGAMAALTTVNSDGVFMIIGSVVAVDTFAYFAGRKFGGPKIAPSISPSKTWAGLIGGIVGAIIFWIVRELLRIGFYDTDLCQSYFDYIDSFEQPLTAGQFMLDHRCHIATAQIDFTFAWQVLLIGTAVAVIAQAGDFLESWMKRRAGVKDSGSFIPGHGGVFDRTDGMIAVAFVFGVIMLATQQVVG